MVSICSKIDVYPAFGKSTGAMTLVPKQPVKSSFLDSYMRPGGNIYNSSTEFSRVFEERFIFFFVGIGNSYQGDRILKCG